MSILHNMYLVHYCWKSNRWIMLSRKMNINLIIIVFISKSSIIQFKTVCSLFSVKERIQLTRTYMAWLKNGNGNFTSLFLHYVKCFSINWSLWLNTPESIFREVKARNVNSHLGLLAKFAYTQLGKLHFEGHLIRYSELSFPLLYYKHMLCLH